MLMTDREDRQERRRLERLRLNLREFLERY